MRTGIEHRLKQFTRGRNNLWRALLVHHEAEGNVLLRGIAVINARQGCGDYVSIVEKSIDQDSFKFAFRRSILLA